jgi:UDP-N-acetylglucosamine 2-epimerase (hydrolysing)
MKLGELNMNLKKRKIVFLTGTRADFGKLKSLMHKVQSDPAFEVHIFVTGMHMLAKYGYTCAEVEKAGFNNIYRYINQNAFDSMDQVLGKTISGLSDYIKEVAPDMLVVHGDRVEALAGASVGALNNVLVAHIEGGEVSGTIDELIRHAVSKLSHIHFVSNEIALNRLIQLGESRESIHVIGSPDIDVMNSDALPTIAEVLERYAFDFEHYGILLFHPVTSELDTVAQQAQTVVDQVTLSGRNYIVIYPNNDHGAESILQAYKSLKGNSKIRIYPSMRFEYFLTLLKHADFIIGNSSAGVREAPHYGTPAINLGSRQHNRVKCDLVLNIDVTPEAISSALRIVQDIPRIQVKLFGNGNSAECFYNILTNCPFWGGTVQKYFVDRVLAQSNEVIEV